MWQMPKVRREVYNETKGANFQRHSYQKQSTMQTFIDFPAVLFNMPAEKNWLYLTSIGISFWLYKSVTFILSVNIHWTSLYKFLETLCMGAKKYSAHHSSLTNPRAIVLQPPPLAPPGRWRDVLPWPTRGWESRATRHPPAAPAPAPATASIWRGGCAK